MEKQKVSYMQYFKLVWIGQMVSSLGSGMTMFGLAIYVFQTYESLLSVSLVTLVAFGPQMLLSLFAGVLSDKYNRLVLMMLGDGLSVIGLMVMLVFDLFGGLTLLVIILALGFNAVVGSLLEPAYKALVSDMTLKSEYTKASGLVQLASATKFILAPFLAGMVLAVGALSWLLIFDMMSFVLTCTIVWKVKKVMPSRVHASSTKKEKMIKETFGYMNKREGLMSIVYVMTLVTLCVGFIQTLFTPLLLSMGNEQTAGLIQSIGAMGMIVGSVIVTSYQKKMMPLLVGGLLLMGVSLIGLGMTRNVIIMTFVAVLMFGSLPLINTAAEVLIRKTIKKEMQGRVWGFVGLVTQLGYIIAYMTAGVLADYVFNPLLGETGSLAESIGLVVGVGPYRGIGLMFVLIGVVILVIARVVFASMRVQRLEESHDLVYV